MRSLSLAGCRWAHAGSWVYIRGIPLPEHLSLRRCSKNTVQINQVTATSHQARAAGSTWCKSISVDVESAGLIVVVLFHLLNLWQAGLLFARCLRNVCYNSLQRTWSSPHSWVSSRFT